MDSKKHIAAVIRLLRKAYPELKCGLNFGDPFQLLVATILSAQTTDALVNRITPALFRKYRTVRDFAASDPEQLAKDLSLVNFYNNKSRNIRSASIMIMEKFSGNVPKTMEELVMLPGVARKTANIILYNAFGINEGIAVDTHVIRLSNRLGLTNHSDPKKIEQDLISITPKKEWGDLTHLLISHGRAVCQARKPMHEKCVLSDICPSNDI